LFTQQLLGPSLHLCKTCEMIMQTPCNTLRRCYFCLTSAVGCF